jgi:outer membrane protein assembly factor BamB
MNEFAIHSFHKLLRVTKLIFIVLLFSSLVSCQTIKPKQQTTADGFYSLPTNEAVKTIAPQEIRRLNKPQTFSKAAIEKRNEISHAYINEELNSRLPFALNNGGWKIKWQADLSSSFMPLAVLETKDRIVIESDGIWWLFDKGGKKIQHGPFSASRVVLDNENFYVADSTGLIVARRLSDGGNVFGLSLFFGQEYERTFMIRKGRRFLAASTERELDPDVPDRKENSLVELVDLGESLKTDDDGLLKSSKSLAHLVRKTRLLLTAAHGEVIVFATQNRIYLADMNLNVTQAFAGDFTPVTMSIDEAGRIYLIVEEKKRRSLWLLFPTGELTMTFELPSSFGEIIMPPVIGYNHQAYIITKNKILVVSSEGKLIWQSSLEKKIGGASITTDEQLLVSTESELLAFDTKGQKQTLFAVSNDNIQTSPVLTSSGEILFASVKRLYCLSVK